jgi:hypothetical protein
LIYQIILRKTIENKYMKSIAAVILLFLLPAYFFAIKRKVTTNLV